MSFKLTSSFYNKHVCWKEVLWIIVDTARYMHQSDLVILLPVMPVTMVTEGHILYREQSNQHQKP